MGNVGTVKNIDQKKEKHGRNPSAEEAGKSKADGIAGKLKAFVGEGNVTRRTGIILLACGLLRVIAGLLVKDNRKLLAVLRSK